MKRNLIAWAGLFIFAIACLWAKVETVKGQQFPALGPRTHHWILYEDNAFKLIKIQDGDCSLYISEPNTNAISASPVQMVAGPGCHK